MTESLESRRKDFPPDLSLEENEALYAVRVTMDDLVSALERHTLACAKMVNTAAALHDIAANPPPELRA